MGGFGRARVVGDLFDNLGLWGGGKDCGDLARAGNRQKSALRDPALKALSFFLLVRWIRLFRPP